MFKTKQTIVAVLLATAAQAETDIEKSERCGREFISDPAGFSTCMDEATIVPNMPSFDTGFPEDPDTLEPPVDEDAPPLDPNEIMYGSAEAKAAPSFRKRKMTLRDVVMTEEVCTSIHRIWVTE